MVEYRNIFNFQARAPEQKPDSRYLKSAAQCCFYQANEQSCTAATESVIVLLSSLKHDCWGWRALPSSLRTKDNVPSHVLYLTFGQRQTVMWPHLAALPSSNHNPSHIWSYPSSLPRHEERPDFKKVEESMRSYHYSISNKATPEGAAAAAEPIK